MRPPSLPQPIRLRAGLRREPIRAGGRTPASVLAASLALAMSPPAALALNVVDATSGSIRPGSPITLRLDRAPTPDDGTLAVFIGRTDVTSLFRLAGNELLFTGREFALATGEYPLVVWQVEDGQWREIHRSTLSVVDEDPPAPASSPRQVTPTLDLTGKAQVLERTRGTATPPPRPTFSDLAMRGGLAVESQLGPISAKGNASIAGSSYRQEALQFSTRGDQAPKVDLADYRFDLGHGPALLSVGHIGWGNHPMLLNSYNSRGLIGAVKLGSRLDVSVNAMNGTSVVGFENLFGLSDSQHRIYGASLGIEADPSQAGWLRGEVSYVDASILAQGNFNRGDIPVAERSRGFGLRLLGRMLDGRLRADVALARNEYRPADDPQLSQGQSLTPLQVTTRSAYMADLAFDLLQGRELAEGWPLTLTPMLRYEQVAPLYKVVGASISADQRVARGGLTARLGALQVNWARSRREDNLDNIASLLKTRTESDDVALALPLPEMLRVPSPAETLWPRVAVQWQSNHQFAVNAPTFEDSGLLPTHRPDQTNRAATLSLGWNLGRYSVNYAANRTRQDNRQPGRELADFLNTGHQLAITAAWSEALNLNAGVNRTRQYSYEKQLASYTNGAMFGLDWRISELWTLSGSYAVTRGDDSRDISTSNSDAVQTQLVRRFTLPGMSGAPMAGQWFVRHALQGTSSTDREVGTQSGGRNWAISLGASLSIF